MDRECAGRHTVCDRPRDPGGGGHAGCEDVRGKPAEVPPDGKLVLISRLGDGDLVIYDAVARKEFKRVKIGHGAAGILMDPEGNRAFISCGPDNYVAVLDLKTLEVTGHIDVGGEPDGLAWATRAN